MGRIGRLTTWQLTPEKTVTYTYTACSEV